MSTNQTNDVQEALDQVAELEAELETIAEATAGGAELDAVREALHRWVDGVTGASVNAALGRVTLVHENGRRSSIASADLPYLLSAATRPNGRA